MSSLPTETKAWVLTGGKDLTSAFQKQTVPLPPLGPNDVLIKLSAISFNYRDIMIPSGIYPFPFKKDVIPISDGAGTIIATGSSVTNFSSGDLVTPIFNQAHYSGPHTPASMVSGLGGALDGLFRSYAVIPAASLVRSPQGWSAREASTLPCAAVTAWNCLYGLRPLGKGQNVLVLGSGGVSIFALQFAKKAGAFVVATTSSEEKAQKLKELGADGVVNYAKTPAWGEAARALTPDARGFDIVIDVVGDVSEGIKAAAYDGVIHIVGTRGGAGRDDPSMRTIFSHLCALRPVYVGSRAQHEEMVRSIDEWGLKPVLEVSEGWEDAGRAYDEFNKGKHFGKVVVDIGE